MRSALASMALLFGAPAAAEPVVAVLSSDHGVYRRALDGFEAALGSTVPVRLASADLSLEDVTKIVVAIGGRAALRSYPEHVHVVYCLAPGHMVWDRRGPWSRVRVVPRPDALLVRIKKAQPKLRTLAVFWSLPDYGAYARAVETQARRSQLEVLSIPADSSDLPRMLRHVEGKVQAVLLTPDPSLVTPTNFRLIGAFARQAGVVFYAPTVELVREGATAAVAVAPEEMGRAAAALARQALAGATPPREAFADRVDFAIDPERAALTELTLSTDAVKADPPPTR